MLFSFIANAIIPEEKNIEKPIKIVSAERLVLTIIQNKMK